MSTKPEPTTEQLSIIDHFRSTLDNIMINAYAGTGKTATLEMIERASRQHPMLYLVFNKKNAEEAKSRMRTSTAVRTFNSFGHRIWADYIGKPLKLDGKKVQTILTEIISTAPRDIRNQLSDSYWFIVDSVNRARALGYIPTGKFPNAEPLVRQGQFHKALEETPDDLSAALIDKVLTECITLSYKGHIDFNDQIYMPALFGGRYPKFPIAMVDEFQDLSPINHAMLDHISKQRIIGVGDIYQNIYGFRGAKADGMNDAQTKFSMHHASLSVSFRCPSNIIARARRQVPDIVAWKHGGEFAELEHLAAETIPDNATFICRNNAPLFALALNLLSMGKSIKLFGSEIGPKLIGIMRRLGPDDMTQAASEIAIDNWLAERLDRESTTAVELAECMRVFVSKTNSLRSAIAYVEHIFTQAGTIKLLTGHKSKGLEFPLVYHLDPFLCDKTKQQDRNLDYVITTRSSDRLYEINSTGIIWP